MAETHPCPQCGAEVPRDAPEGLCPSCALKAGLQTGGGSQTGAAATGGGSPAESFRPPTPAELAAHFPELEILELVGQGGMGVVYKARQKRLDRLVALKILSPKIGQDPAFADRFAREARAMATLSHPHVVTVYDFHQTSQSPLPPGEGQGEGLGAAAVPLYYFLMEFVNGVTLRQLLDGGKLAPQEALAIVPQICEALQYAHDKGVVHRDIKPENILIDRGGQVKIADFGLAKLVGREAKDFTLTGAGQVLGTPQYMAPEQIEHPQEVDHRADIYSLGVVFYQMLTGELPIGRFAPPSKKVQIDVRLDEVVLRALEKEPERRYQQASEIKTRVETIAATPLPGKPIPASVNDDAIEQARRQVRGPAIGLLVTGILNWVMCLPIALFLSLNMGASRDGPGGLVFLVPTLLIVLSVLLLVAANTMKRLQAYGFAVAASILAIIISPGNLIGLPIGIWALVVLSRREVRAAFAQNKNAKSGGSPTAGGRKGITAALAVLLLCVIAIMVAGWNGWRPWAAPAALRQEPARPPQPATRRLTEPSFKTPSGCSSWPRRSTRAAVRTSRSSSRRSATATWRPRKSAAMPAPRRARTSNTRKRDSSASKRTSRRGTRQAGTISSRRSETATWRRPRHWRPGSRRPRGELVVDRAAHARAHHDVAERWNRRAGPAAIRDCSFRR